MWGEFRSRDVDLNDLTSLLVRKELLTNFQVERLIANKRDGYFYGNYEVLYMIGAGTFARVYRATERESGRVVAVKVLRMRYMEDFATKEQFMREARMVIPLRHPNIVPIYEVSDQRGRPYMVMEFVEGQNLRDYVKVRKRLDYIQGIPIMLDIVKGLNYATGQGVTHRDLKLSNVLIGSQGRTKLVDFGLAAIAADMSDAAIIDAPNPRSIDYAGLERVTGVKKGDSRSDVFFAGCLLYHVLSGKSPLFETRDRVQRLSAQRYREIPGIGTLLPELPSHITSFITKCMDLRPEKRFQNPNDMLKDLKKIKKLMDSGDLENRTPGDEVAELDEPDSGLVQEGHEMRVMVVEPKSELQDLFRDRLKRRGYRVLIVSNPHLALQRFEDHYEDEPLAHCVVFNSQYLGVPAIEAFNEFGKRESTHGNPAILLVDPENKSWIKAANTGPKRLLLELPVSVKHLRAAIFKLLREPAEAS